MLVVAHHYLIVVGCGETFFYVALTSSFNQTIKRSHIIDSERCENTNEEIKKQTTPL